MRISVTTDGGFTGRGIGEVHIAHADEELERLANACGFEGWRGEYRSPGADLVRYTLDVDGRLVSWTEGANIPAELRALFEAAWKRR